MPVTSDMLLRKSRAKISRFCLPAFVVMIVLAIPQTDAKADEDPLAPPDTSSPRATLKSFLENFEAALRPYYDGVSDHTPFGTPTHIRSVRTIDTTGLSEAERRRAVNAASVLIYEVLSRVELPPYEEVPDAEAMDALPPDEPRRWRVPRTEIEILRVEEGPRKGDYLFSPTTVELAPDFYHRVRHRDYRAGSMENLYERFSYEPGNQIPVRWITALPTWMKKPLLGQVPWKWFAMIVLVAVWALLIVLAHLWTRPRDGEYRYWLRFFLALALMFLTRELRQFLEHQIIISRVVFDVTAPAFVWISYFFGAVAILNFGAAVTKAILGSMHIDPNSIDAHMILLAGRLVAWLAVLGLVLVAASELGIPLAAVITSLGVGGLAVALAARPTLENFIAGITLYFDRPVRVGEWCQFQDVIGAVEKIGLRSTRLRRWDGNLISVPNSQFAGYQLDNYNDVRDIFIRRRLHLRLDTTPEQLRYLLVKVREMLFAHPKVKRPDVRLADFGESFLVVELRCYADTTAWTEYRAIREDVLLRVMEIVREAGSAFAMPAQTTYFARAERLDAERQGESEEQVKEWTESGELPFPDMTTQRQEELAGTLDYPPRGSVLVVAGTKSGGESDKT